MMRFFIVGFIFYEITVSSRAENTGTSNTEVLQASETRYHSNQNYQERNFPNYDRITRKSYDLPVTFKAPHYESSDYWQNKNDHYNEHRRTFFEDYSYDTHGKTTVFPGFYQFMTSIFGATSEPSDPYHYDRTRFTPPYSFDGPYDFRPTEPNYIPPPKPIRASVIKLETITRSPSYPSLETTTKYYPQVGTILNHVLIESSRAQQTSDFHDLKTPHKIPPFKPLPVMPKPGYVHPTTLKPSYFSTPSRFKYNDESEYKYPKSVQDQLPHLSSEEVEIPYLSEKPVPQIFYTESSTKKPILKFPTSTNTLELIDTRSLDISGKNSERKEKPSGILKFDPTTVKSFPGAVEKVKRPVLNYTKKLTAQLDKSSVERVTNLTVQGYSNVGSGNVKLQPVNYVNVRNLINFQMNKFDNDTSDDFSSSRAVNLNDELSLDAKILKDTNWDGLTLPPTSTIEVQKETTTFLPIQFDVQRNKTAAFWEIPDSSEAVAEAKTTEQSNTQTTTEMSFFSSTLESVEADESITTEEITTRRILEIAQPRSQEPIKPVREETETNEATPQPEKVTFRRRYSRRPKVVSFTPYPTAEEVRKKLMNRNYFPKRQKPNITLAFGNKNVLKARQVGKDEVIKFSDEEVGKRRKTGKRRQVFKRIKTTTSERPILS